MTQTLQGREQAFYRSISGTTSTWEGDALSAWLAMGIPDQRNFNGNYIKYLQTLLDSDLNDLSGLIALRRERFGNDYPESGVIIIGGATLPTFSTFTRASSATLRTDATTIAEVGSNVPRFSYSSTYLSRKLLLEGQRQNEALYSGTFDTAWWAQDNITATANSTTSPDGTVNAYRFLEVANFNTHRIRKEIFKTLTSGLSYSTSIFVKPIDRDYFYIQPVGAGFTGNALSSYQFSNTTATAGTGATNCAMVDYGNGWYRLTVTYTASASASGGFRLGISNNGSNADYLGEADKGAYIWGGQFETAAFPSTYIPTTTAAVTRASDVNTVDITSAPYFNTSEGGFIIDAVYNGALNTTSGRRLVEISNGASANERIGVGIASGGALALYIVTGGVSVASVTGVASPTSETRYRIAVRFKEDDYAISVNGATVATDTNGTFPTDLSRITIGDSGLQSLPAFASIAELTYLPYAPSNAQLQAMSAI